MSDFHALTLPFEGEPLTTLTWDGKPAWVGREIGRRLGYAGNGKRLVTRIGREWADEFIEGKDYVLLSGDELAAFKAAVGLGTPEVPSRAGGLLLLLEPGLHLVLTKTNKPIGVRLRRFLVDEVLPQLVRTGSYAPRGPTVVVEETVLVVAFDAAPPPPPTGLAVRREERLARQANTREKWVDFCQRKLQVDTLHRTVDALAADGVVDRDVAASLEVTAAEIALGRDLSALKPALQESWTSPSELAARWGVPVQRIGKVISALGIRGDARFSKQVLNKARGHDRTVFTFVYNGDGKALVEAALRAAGLSPVDDT